MNPLRVYIFLTRLLRLRRRRTRPPAWRDEYEQHPRCRRAPTRRVVVAWSGSQMLPIPVVIEDRESDNGRHSG